MTYKYYEVLREIYEKNPSSQMNSYRSFSDMAKLFKRPYWIMLGVLIIALIGLVIVTIIAPNSPFVFIPMIIIVIVLLLSQIPREKYFYNESARTNELSQEKQDYEEYVLAVWGILQNLGINTPDKILKLKTECEIKLKTNESKYDKINSRIVDMLIGVPIGAFISSIIYADSKAFPTAIGAIILVGLSVLGLSKLFSLINYYSEGYFKDKYLFDALNELDYFEKV